MRPENYGYTRLGICTIPCKAISKSNSQTHNHYLPAKYVAFENTIAMLARACWGQKKIREGWLDIQPYFKNKKHSDLGNLSKGIFDGLKKGNVIHDDKYLAGAVFPAIYGNSEKIELTLWGKV